MFSLLFGLGGKKYPKLSCLNYHGIDVPVSKDTLIDLGKPSGANVNSFGMAYAVQLEKQMLNSNCAKDRAIAEQVLHTSGLENAITVAKNAGKTADWFANVTEGKYMFQGRVVPKEEIRVMVERYFV